MNPNQNYDVYRTEDGTVSKYIHEDGSETAIKMVKSVQSILNPITKKIEEHHSNRNKYSIFISSSVGCYMKCSFCHLTIKKAKFEKITTEAVINNLKEAIEDVYEFNPEIKNKYVKLSWMGMGDAINNPKMVYDVTINLLDWIFEKAYAIGLDGVDLSTVMPNIKNNDWIPIFHKLEKKLHTYRKNPAYDMDNIEYTNGFYSHKNIFRLFYSIGSPDKAKKDKVIPDAMPMEKVIPLLKEYESNNQYPVIFHHLLVDNLNDSEEELENLITFMTTHFNENELRILRYNFCAKSSYKESERFLTQIRKLSDKIKFLKVQVSPGLEVSAACGQFIVKDFIQTKKER